MADFLNYILVWYNVWFTAPIAFIFISVILQLVMGSLNFGGGDADVDLDADADVDVDAGADVDGGVGSHGSSFIVSALGVLNVGKVPFMIILMALFSIWGISGLVVNELLNVNTTPRFGLNPQFALGISFMVAFLCSILGTRYLAVEISRLFPESERASTDYDLIGLTGRVISGRITTTFGTVRVKGPHATELTVSCRVRGDDDVPLKGDTVILVDYDSQARIFDVTKADSSLGP